MDSTTASPGAPGAEARPPKLLEQLRTAGVAKRSSSDNLTEWKDEGIILQLGKDVSWTDRNAWAPCIVEKKIKGKYKSYFW